MQVSPVPLVVHMFDCSRGVAYVQHCLYPAIETSVGVILLSGMGPVPVPDDKNRLHCYTDDDKNDLMIAN